MKLRGITIRGVLLAVVVAAIDCAIVRSIAARGDQAEWLLAIVVITLPMATVLAVGLLLGLRGRWHSFWVGFEIAGWLALASFVAVAYARPDRLVGIVEPLLDRTGEAIGKPLGVDLLASESYTSAEEFVILPLLVTAPLAAVATAVGLLTRWLRVRIAFERFARRPGRPVRTAVVWLLVFFVLPGVGVEAFLRRRIDPFTVRLVEGKQAMLEIAGSNGFYAYLDDGSTVLLPNRARVRVVEDQRAVSTHLLYADGRGPYVDSRPVTVTVLDGDSRGKLTFLPRCFLRPLR
ncbi:MAG TPA: hypothetical protein VG406_04500 [Isosphaeraceae bacterium]|jgi:hypothetical protein|nr:hypothetical protein [Isosphaeraceae bacterium]